MTVQEEIEKYLKEHKLYSEPKPTQRLSKPYKKWYKGKDGNNCGALLKAFGGENPTAWKTWELIRQLSTLIMGEKYIRDIKDIEQAEDICDRLCQFVYDLRCEIMNKEDSNENKD
ncbi:MAG: hypothetical protein ACI4IS_00235 [Acutalibacteraceae bacterium]